MAAGTLLAPYSTPQHPAEPGGGAEAAQVQPQPVAMGTGGREMAEGAAAVPAAPPPSPPAASGREGRVCMSVCECVCERVPEVLHCYYRNRQG